ncbi:lysozyme inhibitor LprI family protein [Ralstonia pseudosolanacearum]|uniref:lysozyme inhibitor LprI family protein n=1 Tax=Ralstonia pseudosolanacearum TaxID=1310165 RepID=UPI001FFA3B9D|nr:lysozyme inhibitor LprI family protein [Ralstonia pseudosolanacearum]
MLIDMKAMLILFASLASTLATAAPDEAVVRKIAQSTGLDPQYIRQNYNACDSGKTPAMKLCASYRWTQEDIRLNRIYTRSIEKAKEMGFEASLIRAQRAWLAYRDAACTYEGQTGAGGGAYERLYVLSCKETLTRERADHLAAGLVE